MPVGAINDLLKHSSTTIDDVTNIAFYFDPKLCLKAYIKNNNPISWIFNRRLFSSFRFVYELIWLLNFFLKVRRIPKQLKAQNAKLSYYSHHKCHIWYGIYASQCEKGVVVSNDSVGEEIASIAEKWNLESNGEITTNTLFKQNSPHSIGYLYGAITEKLGFSRQHGAGKVMALASYCSTSKNTYFKDRLSLCDDGTYLFKQGLLVDRSYKPSAQRLSNEIEQVFPTNIGTHGILDYRLAFEVQQTTETILEHQVGFCTLKHDNIILTGGVAQNSVANGILACKYPHKNIVIPPIPHDSGCSIGAALLCNYEYCKHLPKYKDTAFFGSQYSNDEIKSFLYSRKINFKSYNSLECVVLDICMHLVDQKTVGIFDGPMECGPRALGNRSILALPSIEGITKVLNKHIKYREWFRPYGVIICETVLHKYFDVPLSVIKIPYMTHVLHIKKKYRECFKGVIHVDGTCRVQTVSPDNHFYTSLFDMLSKNGLLRSIVNTSLNVINKPICRTPSHAIACLYTSGLDMMLFNQKYLVEK